MNNIFLDYTKDYNYSKLNKQQLEIFSKKIKLSIDYLQKHNTVYYYRSINEWRCYIGDTSNVFTIDARELFPKIEL